MSTRNILNTTYKVQTDILQSESGINIEDGTIHVIDGKLKVHLGGEIKEIIIVPAPPAEGLFYLQSEDGDLTWETISGGGGGQGGGQG